MAWKSWMYWNAYIEMACVLLPLVQLENRRQKCLCIRYSLLLKGTWHALLLR